MSARVQRRAAAVVAGAVAFAAAILLAASPAAAHAKLVSSNPANGSSMGVGPSQVVLTFDEPVTVSAVRAENDKGDFVSVGAPVVDGAVVTVSWPGAQAPGLYRVGYVIASDDGHPVEGTIIFSYDTITPGEAPSPQPAGSSRLPIVVGVALVAVGLIVVGLVLRRRRGAGSGAGGVDVVDVEPADPAGPQSG
jgi:methionine-rich copper-binding protein CopC